MRAFFVSLLLFSGAAWAQDGGAPDGGVPSWTPELSAKAAPTEVKLGQPLQVTLTITRAAGISVTLPLRLELSPFVELSRQEVHPPDAQTDDPSARVEQRYELEVAAYELGDLEVPPIELTALGPGGQLLTLRSEPLAVRVVSVLANEPEAKLKDLHPPLAVLQPRWWPLYLLLGLLGAALVAGITLLIYRRVQQRRKAEKPPPPPVPAHVTALKKLAALDVDALVEKQRFKELYLQLSEIAREYTGGRWGFDALEMTTTEIEHALAGARVAAELRERLQQFFSECDLVKFAKFLPGEEEARAAANETEQIVRDTARTTGGQPC